MSFLLTCSSPCDLTNEYLAERNIEYIPFHYKLGDQELLDDMGKSMPNDLFYRKMLDGYDTRTSQVNAEEYVTIFSRFMEEGRDILHVELSSGISGSVNSARMAKDILKEKYPDRTFEVVDSLGASSGLGMLVSYLADCRDQGMSLEETARWAEENRLHIHHWFFSTDLKFYIKGGRVTKTAGFVGKMLSICPLLNMDYQGRLIPREKIRTKKKVIREIVQKMEMHAQNGKDYEGRCYISHSACFDDAAAVRNLVEESFPKLRGKVHIFPIGTTIGSHTGPGTVALFFLGDERND